MPPRRRLASALRWLFYLLISYGWLGSMAWLFLRQINLPLVVGAIGAPALYGLCRLLDGECFRRPRRPLLTHFLGIMLFIGLQAVAWRYLYFFADPSRQIPSDAALVAPADGWVVYIRRVRGGQVPVAIKEGREIPLTELLGERPERIDNGLLIGIFMTPMSVHINRAPVAGRIARRSYHQGKPMTSMLPMSLRLMFSAPPYERGSEHIVQNERETLLFEGDFPVYLTRIADPYVDKIELWKKVGDAVSLGERIGMIRMGSQSDLYIPAKLQGRPVELLVKEGQYVFGGKTALLRLRE